MAKFSKSSLDKLKTCDKRLQLVFNEVIKTVDCSILEGHRGKTRQNTLYFEGKQRLSTLKVGIMLVLVGLLMLYLTLSIGKIGKDFISSQDSLLELHRN